MIITRIPEQQGRGNRKRFAVTEGNRKHNPLDQPNLVVVFQYRKFTLSGLWSRCAITGTRLGCRNLVEISVKRPGQDGEVLWVSQSGIAQAKLSGYSTPAEIFKYIKRMS